MVIESDCLQVVQQLSNESRSLASSGAITDSCLAFRSCFELLSFQFIRRSGNVLAHQLATDFLLVVRMVTLYLRRFIRFNNIHLRLQKKKKNTYILTWALSILLKKTKLIQFKCPKWSNFFTWN